MKDVLTKSDIDNYSLPSTLNQRKLTDGKGLYILVTPAGKYWRYNYRFNGEYKTLALGIYPDVSIDQARVKHKIARNQVKRGMPQGKWNLWLLKTNVDEYRRINRG